MKTNTSRLFECYKYLVVFYLVFNCVLGVCTSVFPCYLLIFHQESHIAKAKTIVLCFLVLPALFTFMSTILGWSSVKRKNITLLKFYAGLLSVALILLIVGCLWCFTSLSQISNQTIIYMEEKFSNVASNTFSENWWNDIQIKLKCCGLNGPTDYHSTKAVPFSCCGFDSDDKTKGSCSFIWQKGCSLALTTELSQDLLLLGLIGLCTAFLQIPGVFLTWCYANRISKESKILNMQETVVSSE